MRPLYMFKRIPFAFALALFAAVANADEPAAYIVSPADGATVKSPFTVAPSAGDALTSWGGVASTMEVARSA